MSKESPLIGTEIEILRQRYFIDYSSAAKRFMSQELTILCHSTNKKGINSIFLQIPKLLPNLKIFDADGTQLSLITNNYTLDLIEDSIHSADEDTKKILSKLLEDVKAHNLFILWIMLPRTKRLFHNESRVITLEYDAEDVVDPTELVELEFLSESRHEVFYVITPPPDYEFERRKMTIHNPDGDYVRKNMEGWQNLPGAGIYFNQYENSVTIRVPPDENSRITFTYSFRPKKKAFGFSRLILYFLTGAPFLLLLAKGCAAAMNSKCQTASAYIEFQLLIDKQVELGVGIIGASLILASLFHNQDVRDYFKMWFFMPIGLTILIMLLKF